MEPTPAGRALELMLAKPEASSVAVPSRVESRKKSTFPSATPAPGATVETVAVKVTLFPKSDGLRLLATTVVVLALLTIWDRLLLVLVVKLVSPAYTAMMPFVPAVMELVVKVASLAERVPLPNKVAPLKKFTVPAGVPTPGDTTLTVAVKVTDCPNVDGLSPLVSKVLVDALSTVWVIAELVLPLKLPSPLYWTVMEWAPVERLEVVSVATPAVMVPLPRLVDPSKKLNVPLGLPTPGATVLIEAVKVTDWP